MYFMRNTSIGVTPGPLDIAMQGDHATVRTTVVLTGGSAALLPERGRVHPVVSGWPRAGGDCRMPSLALGERSGRDRPIGGRPCGCGFSSEESRDGHALCSLFSSR